MHRRAAADFAIGTESGGGFGAVAGAVRRADAGSGAVLQQAGAVGDGR